MSSEAYKRVARRELQRHGRDVTMETRNAGSEDDYGDEAFNTDTTKTVTARVERKSEPRVVADDGGDETLADAEVHISDTHDPEDEPPETLFRFDGQEFETVRVDEQDSGILVCFVRRRN